MLYNSYIFILAFLPVVLIGYFLLNHLRHYQGALLWLCGASLYFYGYFNWSYLLIIGISIIGNFAFSKWLRRKQEISNGFRKCLLVAGVAGNLGALFYFKYYDFFVENINAVFGTDISLLHLLLPLGISFFTFQQMSYLIDSYLGGYRSILFWNTPYLSPSFPS